jgi:hypothetical protein
MSTYFSAGFRSTCTKSMQSTGQKTMQASQPVQSSRRTMAMWLDLFLGRFAVAMGALRRCRNGGSKRGAPPAGDAAMSGAPPAGDAAM